MNMPKSIKEWYGECMRKKKLRESWANDIIARAVKEGNKLFKYYCPHCQHWHVTRRLKNNTQELQIPARRT